MRDAERRFGVNEEISPFSNSSYKAKSRSFLEVDLGGIVIGLDVILFVGKKLGIKVFSVARFFSNFLFVLLSFFFFL